MLLVGVVVVVLRHDCRWLLRFALYLWSLQKGLLLLWIGRACSFDRFFELVHGCAVSHPSRGSSGDGGWLLEKKQVVQMVRVEREGEIRVGIKIKVG